MANKQVFGSAKRGKTPPPATTINEAGGRAYAFSEKHALAQYAATGTFNDAFYSSAEDQVETALRLCSGLDPVYIAKLAVWSRESGYMKDMPALLCAHLTTRDGGGELLRLVFPRVIDNGKMLRNFVQIMRSGRVGRKSLGTMPKKLIQGWFKNQDDVSVFRATVGNSPSLRDVIKLVHPKPLTEMRRALYGYIVGAKEVKTEELPELVKEFEAFKKARAAGQTGGALPKVPMEMIQGLPLSESDWMALAGQMSWTQTRMNLNAMAKHGVFKSQSAAKAVSERLRNPELIRKAKVFPYQLLVAYVNTQPDRDVGRYGSYYGATQPVVEELPVVISNALQDAMEIAAENVTVPDGKIVVCPDVSGSMQSPVTGTRKGSTTKATCIDIAALVASVYLRKGLDVSVLPFENNVVKLSLNPRDSIMTNSAKLAKIGGGGTNCSAPLAKLNQEKAPVDLVVFVSDNESWVDSGRHLYSHYGRATGLMSEWNQLKARNPKAKMVCIDIQANGSSQATEDKDILNIGGFSDKIFDTINQFVSGTLTNEHWVGIIEAIELREKNG